MRNVQRLTALIGLLLLILAVPGCSVRGEGPAGSVSNGAYQQAPQEERAQETGFITEQTLESEEGIIHYSYYLPEDYDPSQRYPLMVTMPGYDMMWFGEDSSGANVDWNGFRTWTEQDEPMIVVSAQLEDWGETSARQAVTLTEYFIDHYAVDTSRVYAAGYSAGGETMSQAVSMRPDLYAAYLHGASQWDGEFAPVAENDIAVYIYMAEGDEYYGAERARAAYDGLHAAYAAQGLNDAAIDQRLQMQLPDADQFAAHGITGNYHAAANMVFDDQAVLAWILSQHKQEGVSF